MLRKIRIRTRIIFISAMCIFFSLAYFLWTLQKVEYVKSASLNHTENVMEHLIKQKLEAAVHTVAISIGNKLEGITDRGQQIEEIKNIMYNIRFEDDKSGYYFVYENTTNIALPIKPEAEGKDLGTTQDPNGVYFVRELNKVAHQGGGFVHYLFKKPEKGIQPKLSYVELIPGTQFWIGTGQYIDNITEEKQAISGAINTVLKKNLTVMIVTFAGIILLIILPLLISIIHSINKPLTETETAATRVAEGDLNVALRADGNDEISSLQKSINTMVENLKQNMVNIENTTKEAQEQARIAQQAAEEAEAAKRQAESARRDGMLNVAQQLKEVVNGVTSATEELSAQAEQIKRGTDAQSMKVTATASAMDEMNATINLIAKNAGDASTEASTSMHKAEEGLQTVASSIEAMKRVQELATFMQDNMQQLAQQANDINDINTVITGIAEQTNMLALNAAIEAARAGEAGRGFAVVADEVRNLAENTKSATTEVNQLITAICEGSQRNLDGVIQAVEAVADATDRSTISGTVLEEIVLLAKNVADQINSIATSASQQASTSTEINSSIEDIHHTTNEISKGINITANAISELAVQTGNVQEIISSFK